LANVLIDTVDPAVTYDNSGTPATNLNYSLSGWFNGSQVPVSSPLFTASDGGSGIDFAGSVLAANTYTFTLSVSAESTKVNNVVVPTSTSKTILDVAGNDTVQNFSAQIDKTNPSLGIVDGNAASYNLCDSARPVEPTTNPTDALSDILANSLTTSWVNNTAPSGLGSYSYSASVKDNALNTDSYSKTYTVVAGSAYRGVQQPVNLTGSRSAFKLGSAVPVKFQLTCDTAPISNSVAKLYLAKQDSVASAVNEPTATNSPDIGNQFRVTDTATGQYQFNLSTKAGSQFMGPSGNTVTLGEGTWFMYISLDGGAKFKAAEFDIKK
jgi:hypothetical protein